MMSDVAPEFVRARYASSDAAEAREFMSLLYGCDLKVSAVKDQRWQMTFDQLQAGPVVAVHLDMPADLRFQLIGRDEFVITTMAGGVADIERTTGRECFGRGDVYLAIDPTADDPCRCDHAHAYTISLSRSLVDEVATGGPDTTTPSWEFRSHQPIAGAGPRWVRGLRLFLDIVDEPGSEISPLVVGPAARLLAALALTTFPNTAATSAGEKPAHDELRHASPETCTVSEVAGRWGFANPGRFAANYRAAYGQSPSHTLRS